MKKRKNRQEMVKYEMKLIEVVAAIIRCNNKILATQRGDGTYKDGWEFPGGKIELGEKPQQALIREIREELNVDIEVQMLIDIVDHDYPDFHIKMYCFLCEIKAGKMMLNEHKDSQWLMAEQLNSVEWLPADKKILPKLKCIIANYDKESQQT